MFRNVVTTSVGWKKRQDFGFTLIELMIVLAIIAVLLALALPIYSYYTIRAKISEGLSVANAAVTAVSATCSEHRAITSLTNDRAGYRFARGTDSDDYVWDIQASGSCSNPVITIETINTGRLPDPLLTITGKAEAGNGQITWRCRSNNTPNNLLPGTCRS